MTLRVVGAGLGRTGTMSLKHALERLLGAPCYHMTELLEHPQHVGLWDEAARGGHVRWEEIFDGYAAAVDWPVASFWPELSERYPDALVILSVRDPESWWRSASDTIFATLDQIGTDEWRNMIRTVFGSRFTSALDDREACIAAYERHVNDVRRVVPAGRLLEWQPADGWGPLCTALDLPAPRVPFPRVNTRAEFLARSR